MKSDSSTKTSCWKQEYPVKRSDEHRVSRRGLLRALGLSSFGLLLGAILQRADGFWLAVKGRPGEGIDVAKEGELEVGEYRLFQYPNDASPAILIRLDADRYVAFSQSCTHLMCPVHFSKAKRQLVCPCHEGYFSAEDGRVLAGPPPRSLPQYAVRVVGGRIRVI